MILMLLEVGCSPRVWISRNARFLMRRQCPFIQPAYYCGVRFVSYFPHWIAFPNRIVQDVERPFLHTARQVHGTPT